MLAAELLLTVVGWFAVSIALAFLIGRVVRLADARQPRMRRHLTRVL
ncbi:hypothetical protein [Amnibacterium sp.]|nr:hypothetical protein [Amnibacterium sp.]